MIDGIILAGGKSTRMGTNKLLLEYKGHPLIWYTIQAMKPHVGRIIIVTGKYDNDIRNALKDEKVTFIYNSNYEKGMFSSVQAGVREVKGDFFLIPGDCPFVKSSTYLALLNGKGDIRVPQYHGEDGHLANILVGITDFHHEALEIILAETVFTHLLLGCGRIVG